jgi:hypothetical protein
MAKNLESGGHDLFQDRGVKRLRKTTMNFILENGQFSGDLTRYIPSTDLVHHSHKNQIGAFILVVGNECLEFRVIWKVTEK